MEAVFWDSLVLAGCVWIGWHLRGIILLRNILRDPDRMIKLINEVKEIDQRPDGDDAKTNARRIRVEKHGDELYLFAEDNDEFLAQGSTLEVALERIEKRFPGDSFRGIIKKEDAEKWGITAK
jgi:hypothetical protein